ncbi:MAG: hypothetical protein CVV11_20000 [Gammaproteobacteria bacterium HGW-Gammaproteobacteria-15]|nr:MAG: hypothetical protein CVV11_20000 [Gammaproteobacteria bacterium HGW-Gammaproteobacteria-15]
MTLNKTHVAILRNLTLGSVGTAYGLSKQLKLEKALVDNMVRQLEYVGFIRKADKDALKITENGQRVLQCIAKNESYDHLLPAATAPAEATTTAPAVADKAELCSKDISDEEFLYTEATLIACVLLILFEASKSVGINKTAKLANGSHGAVRKALYKLADLGLAKKYTGGSFYITPQGRKFVSEDSPANFPDKITEAIKQELDALIKHRATDKEQAARETDDEQAAELAAHAAASFFQLETDKQILQEITEKLQQPVAVSADISRAWVGADIDSNSEIYVLRCHVEDIDESLENAVLSGFNFDQMASEFEQEQSSQDHPVIDDISAKERALGYCSLLLSPHSTELKRAIEALQMDLAVIRLHQERRA